MPMHDLIPSFNAGEVSPLIDARTSLEKYKSSCRTLENFIIMPYGGVNRRPGTEFISEVIYELDSEANLASPDSIPFSGAFTSGFHPDVESATQAFLGIINTTPIDRYNVGEKIRIDGFGDASGDGEYVISAMVYSTSDGQVLMLSDPDTLAPVPIAGFPGPFTGTTEFTVTFVRSASSRLVPFNYSPTTRFIIEFGNHYIRIFNATETPTVAQVLYSISGTYFNASDFIPYADVMLDDLQFCQINDVLYISCPQHPIFKLIRGEGNIWSFDDVTFDTPPTLDQNEDKSMTLTADGTTGEVELTATGFVFDYGHVGSIWTLAHSREIANVSRSLKLTGETDGIQVVGNWEMTTSGTWTGNLFLERSTDNGTTYEVIRSWNSTADRNYSSSGTQPFPALLRLRFAKVADAPVDSRALLQVTDSTHTGSFRILQCGGTAATVEVLTPLYSTSASYKWSEGAFSDYRGYFNSCVLHEQRLFLGGTQYRPMTVYGSQIDDFENFRVGTLDSDGLSLTMASTQQNKIQWIISQDSLIIGTNGDEWVLSGSDLSKTISPTNVRASNQSRYGSSPIQAVMLSDVIIFVQRNKRKVRELVYSFERDNWVAVDLTIIAEHVTAPSVSQISFQQQPDAIMWMVRSDGQLVGMSYERDQNVVGWHRHVTDGEFQSVAVVPGNGTEDEVWFVVKRTIDGEDKWYIERFSLNWRYYLDEGNYENWRYVDCHKTFLNAPASTAVSGLAHLEGKTVTVFTDAGAVENHTVSGGAITLSTAATGGVVGLPYTSTLQPMRLNMDLQDGTSQGRKARIHGMIARLYKSRGGEAMTNAGKWYALGAETGVFTGDRKITLAGNFDDTADVTLRQTKPFPLTVIAIIPKWDSYGAE